MVIFDILSFFFLPKLNNPFSFFSGSFGLTLSTTLTVVARWMDGLAGRLGVMFAMFSFDGGLSGSLGALLLGGSIMLCLDGGGGGGFGLVFLVKTSDAVE